jgi:L-lactate dehydrogenase (cytochrome)
MMIIGSASDYRLAARRRLPRFLFDYIDGAANDEVTARRNIEDLQGISLRQRVLADVSTVDVGAHWFGRDFSMPVALAPVGLTGMYARRGEVQAARAASAANIPMCLSTVAICSLDEVARAGCRTLWFQLYVMRDRGFMREMLARVREAGCHALVFTVDMPVPGSRYRDVHSGMSGRFASIRRYAQALTRPGWAWDVGVLGRPHQLGNVAPMLGGRSGVDDFMGWMARNFDPSVTWKDLEWLREHWDRPLILKGILDASDARAAVGLGADGLVVSNHGGRQLDGVLSSARALPPIVDVVADEATVFVDGGVRSGLDVVRMLALGARGVLIGRAWAYALAARGASGVTDVLAIIEKEMRTALALTGCRAARDLNRSHLADGGRPLVDGLLAAGC